MFKYKLCDMTKFRLSGWLNRTLINPLLAHWIIPLLSLHAAKKIYISQNKFVNFPQHSIQKCSDNNHIHPKKYAKILNSAYSCEKAYLHKKVCLKMHFFFFFILRSIKMKFDFMQIFNAQSQKKTEWMKKFFNNPMIYFSLNVSSRESDRRGEKKTFRLCLAEAFLLKIFHVFYVRSLLFHVADFLEQWIFSRVFFGLLFSLR